MGGRDLYRCQAGGKGVSDFFRALGITLDREGGEANVAGDRGGHTFNGITQRAYDAWRDSIGKPRQDVLAVTADEEQAFYRARYWDTAHCDLLADRLSCMQFDAAVNHGPSKAIRLLQESLGFNGYGIDGAWGEQTENAAVTCDEATTLAAYFAARQRFYDAIVRSDPTQERFRAGWHNRLTLLARALG